MSWDQIENPSAYLRHLKQLKEIFLHRQRREQTDPWHREDTLCLLGRELNDSSILVDIALAATPCFVVARAYVDAGSRKQMLR